MAPMFEVQSLSMQLGEETKDFQVEGVNSSSEDAIFSSKNKVNVPCILSQNLSSMLVISAVTKTV